MLSNIISITYIKKLVIKAMKEYEDVSCYLFGSYAKQTATISSDIDILVLFDKQKYSYEELSKVKNNLQNIFEKIHKFCKPIYGYTKNINQDEYILFRQYINYGVHLYGSNIALLMNQENIDELKRLEFSNYWTPMYLEKIQSINNLIDTDLEIDNHSIVWQYLFLITYWYAKAQLTLIDKQNSLNNFTLVYIYTELMQFTLTLKQKETLEYIQNQRDSYKDFTELESKNISFLQSFTLVKSMIKVENNKKRSLNAYD